MSLIFRFIRFRLCDLWFRLADARFKKEKVVIFFSPRLKILQIAYSCDTLFDLEKLKLFHEQGVLNEQRYKALRDFNFQPCDLLIHESGI